MRYTMRKCDWRETLKALRGIKRGGYYIVVRASEEGRLLPRWKSWGEFRPTEHYAGPISEGDFLIEIRGGSFTSYEDIREILENSLQSPVRIAD